MLGLFKLLRRIIEGSILSIVILAVVALLGLSSTVNLALAEPSAASLLFLLVLAIVLADLIGKFISILSTTFPDLIPAVEDEDLKRASLIQRLRPGQTVALLSGAYAARLVMFLAIFALLGASYAWAPLAVQETLVGPLGTMEAITVFIREGIAGSLGYFLFFLGPDNLKPVTDAILAEPLTPATPSGDAFLVGIRIYGLAFMFSALRTLVTPITYWRARKRARKLATTEEATA
ncbi:MAG: hypothetical protein V7672_02580 [Brevundimonas sp.]|uniref:hypothetical protein n=1 Tax=Brevundimonas sp. TaxID=1871086 RepID=UPI00300267FF